MKKIINYALCIMNCALIAACSSDDDAVQSNYPADGVVRFDVGINEAQSRASHATDGSTLKEFGVFIYNANTPNGTESPTYTYNNVKVTGSNSSAWTTASQMLWQNESQSVDIVAYSPYSSDNDSRKYNATDVPVKVETAQSAGTYKSDFLICKKSSFLPSSELNTDGKVDLEFTHALSQLTVTVTFGTELNETKGSGDAGSKILTADPIDEKSISIGGTKISGTCDFTKLSSYVTASSDAAATNVTAYSKSFTKAASTTENATAEYQCILIPQTVEANGFSISFTIGGKTYKWTSSSEVKLAENTSYTLPITVGSDKIIVNGGITAKPWTSAGEKTLTTD